MAPSAWKLVVTSLGTQSSALEAEVWADNWLSAVRAGRALLGEDGGIPQGASCAMSETGVVTILDAANRRRYVVQRAENATGASASAALVESADTALGDAAAVVDRDTVAASTATPTAPAPSASKPSSQDPHVSVEASAPPDDSAPRFPFSSNDRPIEVVDEAARKKEREAAVVAPRADDAKSGTAQEIQASRAADPNSPTVPSTGVASPPESSSDAGATPSLRASRSATDVEAAASSDAAASPSISAGAVPSVDAAATPSDAAATPTVDAAATPSVDAAVTPSVDAAATPSVDAAATPSVDAAAAVSSDANSDAGATPPSHATHGRDAAHGGEAGPSTTLAPASTNSASPADTSPAQPSASAGSAKPSSPDAPATTAVTKGGESLGPTARSTAAPVRASSSPGTLPPVDSAAIRAAAERAAQSSPVQSSPAQLDDAQRSARAKQTRAYSAQRAESLRREFELSRSLSSFAPPGGPGSDNAALPRPNLHAVPPVQRALDSSASASGSVQPKAASEAPQHTDDDEHGRTHPEGLVPMSARDVDPSEESPLTYRERAYWAASTDDHARLEALLQAEYIKLRRTLIDSPRGQLIHLAAFDHVFEEQPERPPLATLEWKDWRGTAVFSVTQTGPSSSPRASSTRRRPSSPESSWPVPTRSWPGGSSSTSSLPPSSSSWPMPAGSRPPESGRPSTRGSGAPARPRPPSREPVPSPSSTSVGTSLDLGWPLAPIAAPAAAAPDSAWPTPSSTLSNPSASSSPTTLGLPTAEPQSWPSAPSSNAASQSGRPKAAGTLPLAPMADPAAPVRASEEEESDEWPVLVGGTLTAAEPASLAPPSPKPSVPTPSPADVDAEFELAVLAPIATPPPPPAVALSSRVSSGPASGLDAQREPTGEVDSRLTSAFEAMPDLYFLPTPIAGLEFTIALIGKLVSCEAVSACLYDINTDEFRFVALSGPGAQTRRASAVKSQAGLFGCAKRDPDESLVVNNATRDSRFDAQVDGREGLEVRTLAYFPLRLGNQLLGMLQLINRTNERDFSSSDVAVLSYVSTQLAEFLFSRRTLRS